MMTIMKVVRALREMSTSTQAASVAIVLTVTLLYKPIPIRGMNDERIIALFTFVKL